MAQKIHAEISCFSSPGKGVKLEVAGWEKERLTYKKAFTYALFKTF